MADGCLQQLLRLRQQGSGKTGISLQRSIATQAFLGKAYDFSGGKQQSGIVVAGCIKTGKRRAGGPGGICNSSNSRAKYHITSPSSASFSSATPKYR